MNNKETIKKIFWEFIKTTWKGKFFLVVFFGFFVDLLLANSNATIIEIENVLKKAK